MCRLPETHPYIHDMFMAGKFVVKRQGGPFSAVAADMALEQTINKSSKSSGGIIGSTKKKVFVGQWNLTYHELLAVGNAFRQVSGVKATNTELNVSNRFSASQTATNENSVTAMIHYVEKFENPFHVTDDPEARKLHNILTRAVMPDDIRHDLLAMKENGDNNYQKFRKERYIDKAVPLSSVIHRVNIKTFASVTHASRVTDKVKRDKKSISQGQKMIDLARVRGYDMKEVFKYDLVES